MHSDEALLAIVFILIFHFYNEHLKPEVFPMNWMWLTGKMSTEQLKHHIRRNMTVCSGTRNRTEYIDDKTGTAAEWPPFFCSKDNTKAVYRRERGARREKVEL